jgi:restriction endonuclease S subunit
MDDWKQIELNDACSRLSSGKSISAKYVTSEGIYPIYGGNGIRGYTDIYNFDGECAIIGRQGAYCGNVRYFSGKAYMTEHAVVTCGNESSNTRFLAYLLSTMQLGRLSGQSAQPGLSVKTIGQQVIKLPPLKVQNIIADMLTALDEKIEVNESINKNLEQQAFTIFNNMFPNVSTGNNLIGDLITPQRGKNLLSKDAIPGKIPVVAGGLEPATYHNQSNTVPPVLTISSSGANAGFVNLWNIPVWSSDSSFIDSDMTDDVYFWYVMLKIRQQEIFDAQTGSAQPHIYPKHIAAMPVIDLNPDNITAFNNIVTPLFQTIGKNKQENIKLAEIRDTLLPKLMSGELDISSINL